jgi:hypothetical protein
MRADAHAGTAPPSSPASRGAFRVQAHDAQWKDLASVTLLAGLGPEVDAASLRAALRRLYDLDPTAPALCRIAERPLRWVPVPAAEIDAWLDRMVVDVRGATSGNLEATAERLLRAADDAMPLRLTLGDGYLAWQISHVLGDGIYVNRHAVAELARCAVSGEVPTGLVRGPARPRLLLRAAWRTFVRHPRMETWRAAHARLKAAPPSCTRGADPGTRQEALSVVNRISDPGVLPALQRWRDIHATDTTVAAVTMSAVRRAFEAEGAIAPSTDTVVLFDARRYLPPGVHVVGNFSAALRLGDHAGRNPRLMARQMRRDAALGLPLVSLAAAAGQQALASLRRSTAEPVGSGSLVLTHLGALPDLADLPWVAPEGAQRVILAPAPSPAVSMTACISEWRGRLNLTISFDGRLADRAAVTRAVERLVADPCTFLEPAGTTGATE